MSRLITDEHVLPLRDRLVGALGPMSSSFTLAWLASHRARLHTLVLGGRRLSVLIVWDSQGSARVNRSPADEEAVRQLVYGDPEKSA